MRALILIAALIAALVAPAYADLCNQFATCGQCESAAQSWQCGWCNDGSGCSMGTIIGPSVGQCLGSWSYQTCPTDGTCEAQQTCGGCNSFSYCIWCTSSGGTCMPGATGPIPGQVCLDYVTYSETCSSTPGGGGAGGDVDSYPTAGVLAIIFLVMTWVLLALRFTMLTCMRRIVPVLGSRIPAGMLATRDYSRGCRGSVPYIWAGMSIVLKVVALGLDRWDSFTTEVDGMTAVRAYFGVLKLHMWISGAPGDGWTTMTYRKYCDMLQQMSDDGTPGLGDHISMCHTQRAAGILTLITCILAAVFSAALMLLSLFLLCRPSRFAARVVTMWRLAGFAHVFVVAGMLFWALSAHLVIHHDNGDAGLGASWYVLTAATTLDLTVLIFLRNAVSHTPGGAVPVQGYVVLQSGQGGAAAGAAYPFQPQAGPPMPYAQPYAPQPAYAPGAHPPQGYGPPQQYADNAYRPPPYAPQTR